MKLIIAIILGAAVATFTGVVAYRLSSDALAMIIGVVLGLAALIPTLLLAAVFLRRKQEDEGPKPMYQPQPPVIVVGGGFPSQMLPQQQSGHLDPTQAMIPAPPAQQPRQFRMMGYEETEAVDLNDDEWSSF